MKLDALIAKLGELYLSQGNVEVSVGNHSVHNVLAIDGRINIVRGIAQYHAREHYGVGFTDSRAIFSAAEFNDSF